MNSRSNGFDVGIRPAWGFTLVELMVVIAMVAILSAIAAPNFTSFIGTMNSKAASMDLIGDLAFARSESLKRNASASIVPLGSTWNSGWEVRLGTVVLRNRSELKSGLTINAPSAGIVFLSNGRVSVANADVDTSNLAWTITSSVSGVPQRCVVMLPSGSARAKMGAC